MGIPSPDQTAADWNILKWKKLTKQVSEIAFSKLTAETGRRQFQKTASEESFFKP